MGVQKVLIVSKKRKGRRPLEETKTSKERRKEPKIGNFKRITPLNGPFSMMKKLPKIYYYHELLSNVNKI